MFVIFSNSVFVCVSCCQIDPSVLSLFVCFGLIWMSFVKNVELSGYINLLLQFFRFITLDRISLCFSLLIEQNKNRPWTLE